MDQYIKLWIVYVMYIFSYILLYCPSITICKLFIYLITKFKKLFETLNLYKIFNYLMLNAYRKVICYVLSVSFLLLVIWNLFNELIWMFFTFDYETESVLFNIIECGSPRAMLYCQWHSRVVISMVLIGRSPFIIKLNEGILFLFIYIFMLIFSFLSFIYYKFIIDIFFWSSALI